MAAHASPDAAGEARDEIRLDDALKLMGIASTGGHAKHLVQTGAVRVNGAVETHRKRKLHEGDVVEVAGEQVVVAFEADDAP